MYKLNQRFALQFHKITKADNEKVIKRWFAIQYNFKKFVSRR